MRRDGDVVETRTVAVGRPQQADIPIPHAGANIVEIEAAPLEANSRPSTTAPSWHRRRPRQAARASGVRRTEPRRADLAQLAQVGRLSRSRAFHHSAPAGEAGRHADQRTVADRISHARTVPTEDRRVSAHHLRSLRASGRAADHVFRQHHPLRARRRRGAGGRRPRLREPDEHLAHAARCHPAGGAERQRHRARLSRRASPSSASAIR